MTPDSPLRDRRRYLGLTQKEVARMCAVSVGKIRYMERNGAEAADGGTLLALAETLEVSPNYLLGWPRATQRPGSVRGGNRGT